MTSEIQSVAQIFIKNEIGRLEKNEGQQYLRRIEMLKYSVTLQFKSWRIKTST